METEKNEEQYEHRNIGRRKHGNRRSTKLKMKGSGKGKKMREEHIKLERWKVKSRKRNEKYKKMERREEWKREEQEIEGDSCRERKIKQERGHELNLNVTEKPCRKKWMKMECWR